MSQKRKEIRKIFVLIGEYNNDYHYYCDAATEPIAAAYNEQDLRQYQKEHQSDLTLFVGFEIVEIPFVI